MSKKETKRKASGTDLYEVTLDGNEAWLSAAQLQAMIDAHWDPDRTAQPTLRFVLNGVEMCFSNSKEMPDEDLEFFELSKPGARATTTLKTQDD